MCNTTNYRRNDQTTWVRHTVTIVFPRIYNFGAQISDIFDTFYTIKRVLKKYHSAGENAAFCRKQIKLIT